MIEITQEIIIGVAMFFVFASIFMPLMSILWHFIKVFTGTIK